MKLVEVKPQFVPIIPEQLVKGVLYVCEPHESRFTSVAADAAKRS